jgi:hypothetical protein
VGAKPANASVVFARSIESHDSLTPSSSPLRKRVILAISCLALLSFTSPARPQSARRIARIEFEGLHNLTTENVTAMTGLKVGDPFSVPALDSAAQHLVDSGLFKNVGYRTRTVGASVTITFQVEEQKSNNSPVVFDNFIWFSDEELATTVKARAALLHRFRPRHWQHHGTDPSKSSRVGVLAEAAGHGRVLADGDRPRLPHRWNLFAALHVPLPWALRMFQRRSWAPR